jgi:hypothetical protein
VPALTFPVTVKVPVLAFEIAELTLPPVHAPTIVTAPALELFTPGDPVFAPPVIFPVTVTEPVLELVIPGAFVQAPPVIFPVTVTEPVLELVTPAADVPSPPLKILPVIDNAPVPVFTTPALKLLAANVILPTRLQAAGEFCVKRTAKLPDPPPATTLAVSVIPSEIVNVPVPALLTVVQVVLTSIVIVWPVLARASSPTPGTTPPVHVAPAEKLPLAADVMRAMAYSPFAWR